MNADDIVCSYELCPFIMDVKTEAFKKSSDQVRHLRKAEPKSPICNLMLYAFHHTSV